MVCNRPTRGSRIKVEPIRSTADIRRIRESLQGRPRDRALFDIGINLPLKVTALLGLTVAQMRRLKPGDPLILPSPPSGRGLRVRVNRVCVAAVAELVSACLRHPDSPQCPAEAAAYLFPSRRGGGLQPSSLHRLVKAWCREVGIDGNFGAATLRKTWGFHQFATFGTDLTQIMHCFGHATRRQTLDYLCLDPQDFKSLYAHEL